MIDNISMFSPSYRSDDKKSTNCKEKSMIGQIAERLIKTTIFNKYLIGNKKQNNSLKDDLENQFYILEKYKNIIGQIERMRNKIFSKKLNDFNFYTFDEYLNDDNDKIFTKSLIKIPYFNSFIQKAKNTIYKKEPMNKKAYSKKYSVQLSNFNLNNGFFTSHLSSNSNNFFCYFDKRESRFNNNRIKKYNRLSLNLTLTPDKNKDYLSIPNNTFGLSKNFPKSTKADRNRIHENNRFFSAERNISKRNSYNIKLNQNPNFNSSGKIPKVKKNISNTITYNQKQINSSNKRFMNDISENAESLSSFSSMDEEKNKANKNKINKDNIIFKNNKFKEEEKMNIHLYNKKVEFNKRTNPLIMKPFKSKKSTTVQLNKKNEKYKSLESDIINKNNLYEENKNIKKSKISFNNEIIKELKELIPIDLNNILYLSPNNIIQKSKKYLKKNGYFCNEKGNIIKAKKGSSNIIINLYKLKHLDKGIYFSVKIKNKDLKNEKKIIKEIIDILEK